MKTNREHKNKGCVETLKMFYSLALKPVTPSWSGESCVLRLSMDHRYWDFGAKPRSKGKTKEM